MKFRILNILLLSCLALFTACEKDAEKIDELPDGKPVNATFYIQSTGTPENPNGNNEKINSWWVAFINKEGNVAEIVTRSNITPAEKDDFKLVLPTGEYTVVSFANKLPTKIDDNTYSITYGETTLRFKKGEAAPLNYETGHTLLWDETAPELWPAGKLVPMTGLQLVTVTGRQTEPFSIEVVRQVAKFEIEFKNVGTRGLNVHGYWIEEFKSDRTSLFPIYSTLGSEPLLPEGPTFHDVHRSLNDMRIEAGMSGNPDIFYTLESRVSSQPQQVYTLCVDVTHDYLKTDKDEFKSTRDTITALLTDLSFVTRNDHIKVPIHLTDYIFRVEAIFYPPIGGYPAQVIDVNNGSYYIRFGSIGDFEICPHARKAEANSVELAPEQMKLQVYSEPLVAGVNIFNVEPYIDENTGEIRGTVGTQKGAARIWVICSIPEKDGEGNAVTLRYVRSILVIRE